MYVINVEPNDVLLGRGAPIINNEGNVRFRKIVSDRKEQYSASCRHHLKNLIAEEVVNEILVKNQGRFLRKVEDHKELDDLLKKNFIKSTNDTVWAIVSKNVILQKVKQALREHDTNNHKVRQSTDSECILNGKSVNVDSCKEAPGGSNERKRPKIDGSIDSKNDVGKVKQARSRKNEKEVYPVAGSTIEGNLNTDSVNALPVSSPPQNGVAVPAIPSQTGIIGSIDPSEDENALRSLLIRSALTRSDQLRDFDSFLKRENDLKFQRLLQAKAHQVQQLQPSQNMGQELSLSSMTNANNANNFALYNSISNSSVGSYDQSQLAYQVMLLQQKQSLQRQLLLQQQQLVLAGLGSKNGNHANTVPPSKTGSSDLLDFLSSSQGKEQQAVVQSSMLSTGNRPLLKDNLGAPSNFAAASTKGSGDVPKEESDMIKKLMLLSSLRQQQQQQTFPLSHAALASRQLPPQEMMNKINATSSCSGTTSSSLNSQIQNKVTEVQELQQKLSFAASAAAAAQAQRVQLQEQQQAWNHRTNDLASSQSSFTPTDTHSQFLAANIGDIGNGDSSATATNQSKKLSIGSSTNSAKSVIDVMNRRSSTGSNNNNKGETSMQV